MDQLLKDQNQVAGVDPMNADQMESTVGAVLSFLKSQGINVDAVEKTFPQAKEMMQKVETRNAKTEETTGSSIMGKLGGLIAGASPAMVGMNATTTTESSTTTKPVDSMPALLKSLTLTGISPQQMESVLPLVASTLKNKCGVNAYASLGIVEPPVSTSGSHSASGGGGILGGLRGFLNDIRSETTGKES